jgi:superfamily I DNA/RNA helicase
LNQYELDPLLYDLPPAYGTKTDRGKRIRAYEAAWARLQHEEPGFAQDELDIEFERTLVDWLVFHGAMLIGEIIPELYRYLRDNPAARERRLFDHVLVDEFQDLNKAEQRVVELLGDESSLCVVGDDDQSIYSFKYANPEGIRDWHMVHGNVDDHSLLDCRRCPVRVVQIANSLISNNQDRLARQLQVIPQNGDGIVEILQYQNLEDEIEEVSRLITHLVARQGVPPGDILILAQRRVIGTPIFENLRLVQIPVKSYYQESELDSVAAQERLSVLKLIVDRDDKVALRWLLGLESNDFRAKAYRRVRQHCERTGLTPWAVVSALAAGDIVLPYCTRLSERFRTIEQVVTALERFDDLNEFVLAWLPIDLVGVDQLREIARSCLEACETKAELLNSIVERITQPDIPLEVAEVRIMSLHRSKGLSSPVVIIAGCVEGLLPVQPDAALSNAQRRGVIEEQRRLFFVGLTRVKAQPRQGKPGMLYLTSSLAWPQADALGSGASPARIRHGVAYFNASRFLGELGPHAPRPRRG